MLTLRLSVLVLIRVFLRLRYTCLQRSKTLPSIAHSDACGHVNEGAPERTAEITNYLSARLRLRNTSSI